MEKIMQELELTENDVVVFMNKTGYNVEKILDMILEDELSHNILTDIEGNKKEYLWYEDFTENDGWLFDLENKKKVHEWDYKDIMNLNFN